jgi:hypothetical protein
VPTRDPRPQDHPVGEQRHDIVERGRTATGLVEVRVEVDVAALPERVGVAVTSVDQLRCRDESIERGLDLGDAV